MRLITRDSVPLFSVLRWLLPLALSLLSIGYVLFERTTAPGDSLLQDHVLRTMIVVGSIGPLVVWLALTWAERTTSTMARVQTDLAFRNHELAVLNAIGQAATQSLNLNEIVQTAFDRILELLKPEAVELRLLEWEELVLKAHHGVSPDFLKKEPTISLGHCLCGRACKTGQMQVQGDLQAEPTLASSACAREGFASSVSIPLKSEGRVLGVLHVASRRRNAFSTADQETLTAIGHRIASAVENSILYEQVKRHAVHLEFTSLIGQQLTSLLDPRPLFAELVRLVCERFGFYHAGILLIDKSTGELVLEEASGAEAALVKANALRIKVGQEGITGWVAHTGQAFLCNDVTREPRFIRRNAPRETRAELAVPLRVSNRVIGVLDVQSDRRNFFSKEDISILQILGSQLSIAIENARLFQETRHRNAALVALHQISLDMIAELDRTELLNALLRRGVDLLGANAAALFVYNPSTEIISCIASYNSDRDWASIKLRPGEAVIGRVIQTGEPLFVNDYENWEGRAPALGGPPYRHTRIVGVPIKWQGQVMGGVTIMNERTGHPFDENDLWLTRQFVDLAAIALKNAELHTRVKEFNNELETEVVARTEELQQAKEEIAAKAHELRSLLAKTIRIQEEEQARIARDLHDGIIQLVTASKYEIQAARLAAGETLPAPAHARLDAARELLDDMQKEIRRTIYDLHPAMLDSAGLILALQKHIARFQEVSGIPCEMQTMGKPRRLSPQAEIALYRIVEEALQNIAVHAQARAATLVLAYEPTSLSLTIQDDGIGFDYRHWRSHKNGKHLGLLAMQERVSSLAGRMKVSSEPGRGTRLIFNLPLEKEMVN